MSNIPNDSDRDSDCEEVERPTGGGRWSEGARVPGSAGLFGGVAGTGDAGGNSASTPSPLPGVVRPDSFEEDITFAKWISMQPPLNAAPLKQTTLPFPSLKPAHTKERLPLLKELIEASKILPPQAEDVTVAKRAPTQTAAPVKQTKLPPPSEMLPLTKELAGTVIPARVQDSSTQRPLSLADRVEGIPGVGPPRYGGTPFPFRTREDSPGFDSFAEQLAAHYRQMASIPTPQHPYGPPLSGPPPPPPSFESKLTHHNGKPMPWATKVKPLEEKTSAPPPVASSSAVPDPFEWNFFPYTPYKPTDRTYPANPTTPKKTSGRTLSPQNTVPNPAYTCPSSNGGGYGVESREDKGCGKRLDVVAERAKMHVDALLDKEKKFKERKNALAAALAARKKHIERLCPEASNPAEVLRAIEEARYSTILSRSRLSPPARPLSLAERMRVPTSNIRQPSHGPDDTKEAASVTVGRPTKEAEPVQQPQNGGRETVEMDDIRRLERDVEQVRATIDELPAKRKREAEDEGDGEDGTLSRAAKRICRNAPAFLTGVAAAYVSLAYI